MNIERLLTLAELITVERIQRCPCRFSAQHESDEFHADAPLDMPSFAKEGLSWAQDVNRGKREIRYGDALNLSALEGFFDLSHEQALRIWADDECGHDFVPAQDVVRAILDVVCESWPALGPVLEGGLRLKMAPMHILQAYRVLRMLDAAQLAPVASAEQVA